MGHLAENGTNEPLAKRETLEIKTSILKGNDGEVKETSVLPEILACVSANSFHLSLGLTFAFSAVLLPQLEKAESDIQVDPITQSPWIASAVPLAVPIGSLITGPIMNYMGRIRMVQTATIPYCIGWTVIATATNVPALIIGRFVSGLAAGTFGTNPGIVYTTEVARPTWRGALISTGPLMVSIGTMLVYLLGALLPWRTVAWIACCAPLVTLTATLIWSPESPLWLAERDRKDALEKAIRFLARRDKNVNTDAKVASMMETAEQRKAVARKRRDSSDNCCTNFLKIAKQRTVLRPLLLLTAIFFVQQFSGIYVVQFYAVTMFQEVGSAMNPNYASVVVGAFRVSVSLVAIVLLRWFPRRPLMVISAIGMILSMTTAGYFAHISNSGKKELDSIQGSLATASLLCYVMSSMIGLLTIPWTMTAELFPPEARSTAQGVTIAAANLLMFGSVQTYRHLQVALGNAARVMWLYSGVAALSIVIVALFLPETHGRPLADIEFYFKTSWLYPGYEGRRRKRSKGSKGSLTGFTAKNNQNGTAQKYTAVDSNEAPSGPTTTPAD